MGDALTEARRIYNRLWRQSTVALKSGGWQIDAHLQKSKKDPRRGATLVARPDAKIRERVGRFLHAAAGICPGHYFYQPAQLHMTVLAVIPGSASWRRDVHRLPACRKILAQVLKNRPAFSVRFRGLTVSPDAVLVQGFPRGEILARLRDDLRNALRDGGVGENLDRRYKIAAAHLTEMRFANPNADWGRLMDFLRSHRDTDFGETHFRSLQLIWSDWCASTGVVRTLAKYALKA